MRTVRATIHLYTISQGGRHLPLLAVRPFSCPLYFKGIAELSCCGWDCRILVNNARRDIYPGETIEDLEIAFLSPDSVFPFLNPGAEFYLWEAGYIGTGIITKIA